MVRDLKVRGFPRRVLWAEQPRCLCPRQLAEGESDLLRCRLAKGWRWARAELLLWLGSSGAEDGDMLGW